MLSRCSIRGKMLLGVAMLFLIMVILAFSSFRGVYSYRWLARSISNQRATELRLAAELSYEVGELRSILSKVRRRDHWVVDDRQSQREDFREGILKVEDALKSYKDKLRELFHEQMENGKEGDRMPEWETVEEIERCLAVVSKLNEDDDWVLYELQIEGLDEALDGLHKATLELPLHLERRMRQFAGEVRGQYHIWIGLTWTSSVLAVVMLAVLVNFFYRSVVLPLRTLIQGSRRVARDGDFNHRIQLNTRDEVAELAGAMNGMTDRFQKIRDDLDRQIRERDEQVRQRTKEVVQQEKLASVGYLAAGVAHEINNPVAAVAWAAEALEMRLYDVLKEDEATSDDEHDPEIAVVRHYLRSIQEEAFRCKGITERLLDFSRMGDMEKQETDISELVEGVIDMVRHLGKYREKNINFHCEKRVVASVNAQEIKQVVLNLITNALDSLDPGGSVRIQVGEIEGRAELVVSDNGCGMSEEVMQHLFEPFYTRRRDGQGTGLGLSITSRIVQDHGGEIIPYSEGPGRGSQFRVTLPLVASHEEKLYEEIQAA
jgi:signal transduction histidine kinase